MLSTDELKTFGHTTPKENFILYLRNNGVLQELENALSVLYELPIKPVNAIEFMTEYLQNGATTIIQCLSLHAELCFRKNQLQLLEQKIAVLDRNVASLRDSKENSVPDLSLKSELWSNGPRDYEEPALLAYLEEDEGEYTNLESFLRSVHHENDGEEGTEEQLQKGNDLSSGKKEASGQAIAVTRGDHRSKQECESTPTPSEFVLSMISNIKKFDPMGLIYPISNVPVDSLTEDALFKGNSEVELRKFEESPLALGPSLAKFYRSRNLPEDDQLTPKIQDVDMAISKSNDYEWDIAYWDQFFNTQCIVPSQSQDDRFFPLASETRPSSSWKSPGLAESHISNLMDLSKVWVTNHQDCHTGVRSSACPSTPMNIPQIHAPLPYNFSDSEHSMGSCKKKCDIECFRKAHTITSSGTSRNGKPQDYANVRKVQQKERPTSASAKMQGPVSPKGVTVSPRSSAGNKNSAPSETASIKSSKTLLSPFDASRETSYADSRMNPLLSVNTPNLLSLNETATLPNTRPEETFTCFDPVIHIFQLRAANGLKAESISKFAKHHFGTTGSKSLQGVELKIYDGL